MLCVVSINRRVPQITVLMFAGTTGSNVVCDTSTPSTLLLSFFLSWFSLRPNSYSSSRCTFTLDAWCLSTGFVCIHAMSKSLVSFWLIVQCAATLILKCIHQCSGNSLYNKRVIWAETGLSEASVREYNESVLDKSAAGVWLCRSPQRVQQEKKTSPHECTQQSLWFGSQAAEPLISIYFNFI